MSRRRPVTLLDVLLYQMEQEEARLEAQLMDSRKAAAMGSGGEVFTARVQCNGTTDLQYTDDPDEAAGEVMLASRDTIHLRLLEAIATNTATIAEILERLAKGGGDGQR